MDFWSRLIAGTSLGPASNSKAAANNPEKRLARFKKEYAHLLNVWRSYSDLSRNPEAAESIRSILQELTTTLGDESRRPLPHPCIAFAASKQIYIPIGKIAATSYNEGIIKEGVGLFATLIDSEEDDFVENEGFSTSLMNLLVRITGVNSIRLGRETEVEIVELSFNITTKIRLDPDILPVWFTAQQRNEDGEQMEADAHEKFTGKTHKEDFPLFYLLIDYIHDEGRIGDFARTGLLYIIEAASHSVALEQWIVESDLATMMATGLGALYSQLSRKLVIDHHPDSLPPILALSDYEHPVTTSEIVSSVDEGFGMNMETFLAHLVFWQDVLNHCKSLDVKQTLLEHFQVIFLQQLLYPSLLESSDIDGGSSVAVLTYLRRILEALDHPDMIHLILHYLLALPDTHTATVASRNSVSAARKRKSMDLATIMAAQQDASATPALFNLVDLIQGCLRSENQQTVSVTLQLVSAILRRHHRYAVTTLLSTSHVVSEVSLRTVGGHEKEMNFLLTLAGDIGAYDDFDTVYENHLKDCMSVLEGHPCSLNLVAPKTIGVSKIPSAQATIPGAPRDIRLHTLRPEDPMLKTILLILSTFFTNSVETNLSLTGTIVDLATCGFMRLDGWLLPDPTKYTFEEDTEESDEEDQTATVDPLEVIEQSQLRSLRNNRRLPAWSDTTTPAILQTLERLINQIQAYRDEIPRFNDLLQQRRDAFQTTSDMAAVSSATVHQPPTRSSLDSNSRSISPQPKPSALDSLAQRIFEKIDTPSRSRTSSPRGRSSLDRTRSDGSGIGTPSLAPRSGLAGRLGSDQGSVERGHSPLRNERGIDSQVKAFESVDRGILARKVGMSTIRLAERGVEAIPFRIQRDTNSSPDEGHEVDEDAETNANESKGLEDELANDDPSKEVGDEKMVSVSHVLTNVLVLQEFLLELAALVQVRAGLFGEIRFV